VAALIAAEVAARMEKQSVQPVVIEAAVMQRALGARVRALLEALSDLRVLLG
jgi:ribosomal protein L18